MDEKEILQAIFIKLNSMDQEIKELRQDQQYLKVTFESEIKEIKQEQQHFKVILESETNKNIALICEAVETIAEKQKKLYEIDDVKDRVTNLERVVLLHTEQIDKLKKAK